MLTVCLEEKAKPVKEAFPKIKIAIGGLDDSKILEEESKKADVVIRTAIPPLSAVQVTDHLARYR